MCLALFVLIPLSQFAWLSSLIYPSVSCCVRQIQNRFFSLYGLIKPIFHRFEMGCEDRWVGSLECENDECWNRGFRKLTIPHFSSNPSASKRSKKWQLCFVYQYKIIVRLLRDTFHYFLSCNNATSICYKIPFLRECYRCSIILVVFQWYQAVLCHRKITGYILK